MMQQLEISNGSVFSFMFLANEEKSVQTVSTQTQTTIVALLGTFFISGVLLSLAFAVLVLEYLSTMCTNKYTKEDSF